LAEALKYRNENGLTEFLNLFFFGYPSKLHKPSEFFYQLMLSGYFYSVLQGLRVEDPDSDGYKNMIDKQKP
jgi:hypothetical protein